MSQLISLFDSEGGGMLFDNMVYALVKHIIGGLAVAEKAQRTRMTRKRHPIGCFHSPH